MKNLFIAATVLFAACGLSEEKFADEACAFGNICIAEAGGTEIDCDATVEDTDTSDDVECTFDAKQAAECLDAMEAWSGACSDTALMEAMGTACETVYDCPAADTDAAAE